MNKKLIIDEKLCVFDISYINVGELRSIIEPYKDTDILVDNSYEGGLISIIRQREETDEEYNKRLDRYKIDRQKQKLTQQQAKEKVLKELRKDIKKYKISKEELDDLRTNS